MDLIGAPELKVHKTNVERVAHQPAIDAAIGAWTSTLTLAEALAQLDAARIPVGPINSIAEMAADPHFAARGMFESVDVPGHAQPLRIPAVSPKLAGTPGETKWPGQPLGADTTWCLETVLGLSDAEIQQLIQDRVVVDGREVGSKGNLVNVHGSKHL